MVPILFRVALLAAGLAVGEIGLTSLAAGGTVWVIQLALSVVLLVAGSAGFIGPLLGRRDEERGSDG